MTFIYADNQNALRKPQTLEGVNNLEKKIKLSAALKKII